MKRSDPSSLVMKTGLTVIKKNCRVLFSYPYPKKNNKSESCIYMILRSDWQFFECENKAWTFYSYKPRTVTLIYVSV